MRAAWAAVLLTARAEDTATSIWRGDVWTLPGNASIPYVRVSITDMDRRIDALLRKCDDAVSTRAFLAGATLSVADVNLLPFLQRVEDDIPADATHLRGYMARARMLARIRAFGRSTCYSG